ncbi:MAG: M1 family metallopeptidase [Hyphomonadaceae bacterium]
MDLKRIVISPAFGLLIAGSIYLFWTFANNTGSFGDRGIEPVTRLLVKELYNPSLLFIVLTASIFASELVWGDTDRRIHELIDVTPSGTWVYVLPKLAVICFATMTFVLVGSAVGLVAQAAKGYPLFEVGKIALWLWLPLALSVFQFSALALFCHCVTPNKIWGWVLYFMLAIGVSLVADLMGFGHVLLDYGLIESVPLSDFNGQAHFWRNTAWLQLHWTLIACMSVLGAVLMWRRGVEQRFKPRLAALPMVLRSANGIALAIFFVASSASGGWIFYHTNVVNSFATDHEYKKWAAQLERDLAPLEAWSGPTIVAVKLEVDIRPKAVTATANGILTLENRTNRPLTQFILNHSSIALETASMPDARRKEVIKDYGISIWTFTKPLAPGEKRDLTFKSALDGNTVADNDPLTAVVSNGSFIESTQLVPSIRIDRDSWLTDLNERKKEGLPEKRPLPQAMLGENYYTPGSGWVDADITVSTDIGQIPVAPGVLVRETIKNGRVTRQFRSPVKINNLFAIQSANYVVKRERIQLDNGPVELEIYHLPGFTRNLTTIMTAMKTSLQTFSKLYGPYPFGVLRIVQTPSYGAVDIAAQAYAGMVPFYEDGGWLQIIKDTAYSNNLSETVAHEVAHMWWGHQIDPSMRPGAKVLTESLAEMTSWLALQDVFPAEFVISYVNEAEDDYETKRGKETEGEPILTMMEGEEYLAYGKAPVALYILRNEIGHEAFDAALRSFIKRYAFADRPYPSLGDLLATLKAAAKPEVHVLIDQFFTDRVRWHTEIGSLDATKPNKSGSVVSVTAGAWTESLDELGMPYASAGIGRGRIQFFHSVPCDKEQFKSWTKFMTAEDMKSGKGECWASEEVATFTVDFKRTLGRFQFDIPTAKWVETVQIGPALRFRISTLSDSQSRSETFFPPHDFLPSQKPK